MLCCYGCENFSRRNDKKNHSVFSIFWDKNSWLDKVRVDSSSFPPAIITSPFSKYFQILYIFAQILKYFVLFCALFLKLHTQPLLPRIGPEYTN